MRLYSSTFISSASLIFFLTGCGGSDSKTPTNIDASIKSIESKPKAPPIKTKGGRLIESEENTPPNFRN